MAYTSLKCMAASAIMGSVVYFIVCLVYYAGVSIWTLSLPVIQVVLEIRKGNIPNLN